MSEETATPETAPVGSDNIDRSTDLIMSKLTAEPVSDDTAAPAAETPTNTEAPEPSQAQETPSAPSSTHKVKVNGEEREVTLEEALKGYSRTEDYKAKTARIAEQERAYTAAQQQSLQKLEQAVQMIEAIDPLFAEARSTDWAKLAQEDPGAYVAKKARLEQHQAQYQQLVAQRNQMQQEAMQETLAREMSVLAEKLPEFAEQREEVAQRLTKGLIDHYGYSANDLDGITDHRSLLVANDALKWREHLAAQKSAEAKKVAPPQGKTLQPARNQAGQFTSPQSAALKTKVSSARNIHEAADAILALIGDKP